MAELGWVSLLLAAWVVAHGRMRYAGGCGCPNGLAGIWGVFPLRVDCGSPRLRETSRQDTSHNHDYHQERVNWCRSNTYMSLRAVLSAWTPMQPAPPSYTALGALNAYPLSTTMLDIGRDRRGKLIARCGVWGCHIGYAVAGGSGGAGRLTRSHPGPLPLSPSPRKE